jgi:hypothetical protein
MKNRVASGGLSLQALSAIIKNSFFIGPQPNFMGHPIYSNIKHRPTFEFEFLRKVYGKAMSSIALGVWVAFLKQPDA